MKNLKLITMLGLMLWPILNSFGQEPDSTKYLKQVNKDIFKKDTSGFVKLDDQLFEYDLEALMNLSISTVLKKSQSISEAPAIVSLITEDQIRKSNAQSLTELMTTVPGFSVADSYWKRQIVTARGVKMTLYNDKILMLINGIPAYGAPAMEHFLDVVPLNAIESVEIIRGPGSTLYGTNAFSAVINIITKKNITADGIESEIKVGSFGTKEVSTSIGNKIGDKLSYFFATSVKDNKGYKKEDVVDEYGVINNMTYEHDNLNIFADLTYDFITLQSGLLHQKWSKFGPLPGFRFGQYDATGGRAYHDKYYVNLIADKTINNINLKGTFRYDYIDKQSDIGDFGETIYKNLLGLIDTTNNPDYYRFGGQLWQGELQARYSHSGFLSVLGGFSFEQRQTNYLADLYSDLDGTRLYSGSTLEEGNKNVPIENSDWGAYIQFDGKIDKLGYIGGIRASYLDISEKIYISPRAGVVYNLNKSSSIKALYGEAFRGAGPQEQYYKVPLLIYGANAINKGLEPERIKTYELAWDQSIAKKYKLRLNFYLINVFDIINRRSATAEEIQLIDPNLPSTLVYDNLGQQNINGLELEFKAFPTEYLSFWGNLSYKDGEVINDDTVTYDYIPFMEKTILNFGAELKLYKKIAFMPSFQFIGEREGLMANGTDMNKINAYSLLNVKFIYKINSKFSMNLTVNNILDTEHFYPEDVRRKIETIPGGPGRSIFLSVRYKLKNKN